MALSAKQLEAAVNEMNQEMEDLFGSPMRSEGGPSSSSSNIVSSDRRSEIGAAPPDAGLVSASRAAPVDEVSSAAASALRDVIRRCTEELPATTDLDRSTRIATCVAECARAIAELERARPVA